MKRSEPYRAVKLSLGVDGSVPSSSLSSSPGYSKGCWGPWLHSAVIELFNHGMVYTQPGLWAPRFLSLLLRALCSLFTNVNRSIWNYCSRDAKRMPTCPSPVWTQRELKKKKGKREISLKRRPRQFIAAKRRGLVLRWRGWRRNSNIHPWEVILFSLYSE